MIKNLNEKFLEKLTISFISYAQNFEDVMLTRASQNIKKRFYIDIGAHNPTIESVTKAFYDKKRGSPKQVMLVFKYFD